MTVKYKTVITKAGAIKLAAATVPNGKKVNFTAMAIGDGGGTLPVPDASQTKLINEVWRHTLNKISQDNKNQNYVIAELLIPPETGGFWMREMGLYDDTGTLIAVGNMAESYKPELAEGSGRAQTVRMVIMVSDIESVELTIDTSTVMATQDYVDDKLAEHEQSRRHPDATLTEKGFTQLSSATDSASESVAATPKAVKTAYDLAYGKYTAQDATTAQKGIVQLSSATDSASESVAATPKAVKTAYDLANGKYTAQDATTAQKGIVQLSSATDSASESVAATPKAVKTAYDLAYGKYTAQDATTAQKGIVQLSSATDSASESVAATPKAVKTAYDLANGKYTAQDATTAQKGIVQLSSATDSASESVAATPKAVKAANDNANNRVPASGGRVAYLENATYYKTNPAGWYGGGSFANQYRNNEAPFLVPYGFASVKNNSQYLPIVKGISHTEGWGYGAAVSFGILRSGNADFGSAIIQIIGDSGDGAIFGFNANGSFNAPNTIVAGGGLYDTPGVRAYSSNNPPPKQDLSPYAMQSWVIANFGMVNGVRRGGQQLQNPTDAFFGNWESPAGCVVTGITMDGRSDGRKLGVYYRQMQYFNKQTNSWINVGD